MEGRIAFRGADNLVYTAKPDGSDARPLSAHAAWHRANGRRSLARESWPAWSPDGARIAYSHVTAEVDGTLRLELRAADWQTGEVASIYVNPPGSPTVGGRIPHYAQWSADGTYLAFLAATPQRLGLYLAAQGQGGPQELSYQAPIYLAWAPDRSILLVHAQERHLLVDPKRPAAPAELEARSVVHRVSSWSPNGGALAYVWDRPGQRLGLYVADRERNEPREVTPVRALVGFLWSPAGDAFAIGDDQDPTVPFYPGLRVVRLDGVQHALTRERVMAFFWSPDGRRLAYVTFGTAEGTVAVVTLEVGAASAKETMRLEVIPSYALLALLPFFDQYAASHRLWSPDSRYLVVTGVLGGQAQAGGEGDSNVYVVDSEGKEPPRLMAAGSMAFWSPR